LHIIGGNALDESAFSATAQYFNGKNRSLSWTKDCCAT
jgi:hypothetical protein